MPADAGGAERAGGALSLASGFSLAAVNYWLAVFPLVAAELRRWIAHARAIPDPVLRAHALRALSKRGNMEGAAAFATFAPRPRRAAVVRAAVAFQGAYNYLDQLSEQLSPDPCLNSGRLHQALLAALDPSALPLRYYEHQDRHEDGGYLLALIDACRSSLQELPSYGSVAAAARRAAERVIAFQAIQALPDARRAEQGFRRLAGEHSTRGDLRWWEAAGAAGSSLGVHAMLAMAAQPTVRPLEVAGAERAYFPWIGALHTMLDHLVDTREDLLAGQRNLTAFYRCPQEMEQRLRMLARGSLRAARALVPARRHELIVAAMASSYLAGPQARPVAQAVMRELGASAPPALAVFQIRRGLERVYYACGAHGASDTAFQTVPVGAIPR